MVEEGTLTTATHMESVRRAPSEAPIVVAVDRSAAARTAVARAIGEARALNAPVVFVYFRRASRPAVNSFTGIQCGGCPSSRGSAGRGWSSMGIGRPRNRRWHPWSEHPRGDTLGPPRVKESSCHTARTQSPRSPTPLRAARPARISPCASERACGGAGSTGSSRKAPTRWRAPNWSTARHSSGGLPSVRGSRMPSSKRWATPAEESR
jgi:hypothetical protein